MKAITLFFSAAFLVSICSAQTVKVNECLIANGSLQQMAVDYDQATGERYITIDGSRKKFYDVYPKDGAGYAARLPWFIYSRPISFNELPYAKYGLPRVLSPTDVEKKGEYMGVNVYVESGFKGLPPVIYIPVRQGCEFQPYQLDCPQLFWMTGPDSISLGKTATLKFVNRKDQPQITELNWSVSEGTIISGQGTTTVIIAATDVRDDKITVTADYNTKVPCTTSYFTLYIKKLQAK